MLAGSIYIATGNKRRFSPLRRSRADLSGEGSGKTRFRVLLIDSNRVPRVWMNERVGESSHRLNGESPTGDHKVHACVPTIVRILCALCSSHAFSLFLSYRLASADSLEMNHGWIVWIECFFFRYVPSFSRHILQLFLELFHRFLTSDLLLSCPERTDQSRQWCNLMYRTRS